jgi:hypothetical protein
MPSFRFAILSSSTLAALLALTTGASAQAPWKVTIRPATAALVSGQCTPVYLDILDGPRNSRARNGAGQLASVADFDMSVTGGAVVGRYSGAGAWSACACPASGGVSATITATYPAQSLNPKAKVTGQAHKTTLTLPVTAGTGSGVPIGCEKLKTTTAPAAGSAPWTVTLIAPPALPIGTCAAIGIDLRDATGKEQPRNPAGALISPADFDMTVRGSGVAGNYIDASHWTACGCRAGTAGSLATIIATYPASTLGASARAAGVAFQASLTLPLAAGGSGTYDPPACVAVTTTVATTPPATVTPVTAVPITVVPVAPPPVTTTPAPVAVAPTSTKTTTTPTSTEPIAVIKASSPTFVTVSGTPVSATIKWQPMSGVASFVVTRTQTGVPAVEQTLSGSNTGMFDSGLTPVTAYSWTIRAIRADGSEGSTTVSYTTPAVAAAPPPPPAPAPAPAPAGSATAKWTPFKPAIHGFEFTNDFKNSAIGPPINFLTRGLCGGMSYAVLDYYNAGRAVPTQDYRPANNTSLQQYLYARQVSSLSPNLDRWADLTVNPFGSRTLEFFNWGLNEQLELVKASIDRGVPVNLGLKSLVPDWTGHQVLAIGYDAGRYAALGAYKEDLKIYIFDPNHPGKMMTLVPDTVARDWHYLEVDEHWRTYFVDGKYFPMTPPSLIATDYPPDGLVHELRFVFTTGWDNMRGGTDHVDVKVTLADNTTLMFANVSKDGIWVQQYTETAQIVLAKPIPQSAIRIITVSTNTTGGQFGDSWDMDYMQVKAVGNGFVNDLLSTNPGPYKFTWPMVPLIVQVR